MYGYIVMASRAGKCYPNPGLAIEGILTRIKGSWFLICRMIQLGLACPSAGLPMQPKYPLRRFSATVHAIRGSLPTTLNPCVDVPANVVSRLQVESGKKQAIPVRFSLKGETFKANIVRYLGDWRLYLNGPMLKRTGVAVGDKVSVMLSFDPAVRRELVPAAFARALAGDRAAKAAFVALPPSRRKEILRYLNSLKQAASRARNIARALRHLKGLKTDLSPTGLFRTGKRQSGRR